MIEQQSAHSPAISFRDVSSGYRGREVLHAVSFTVMEGEFVSLIGPNGCGKSTLLKTAAALIRPSAGSVSVFGRDIRNLRHAERASLVGVVPQKLESPMSFRVGELVMNGRISAMGLFGRPGPDDLDIVERAMIYTDVLGLRDRFFMELSGGEQQRVALAMVLAQEPRVIMLDESIAHLDINHRQEVLQILMNLNREQRITVVLVSHDLTLSANRLDSDAEAARALHLDMALEQPFSAVSEASCREALLLAASADAVVVAEVPFGSGNLVNLSLAVDALRQGKPVFLAAGIADRDYTEGKAAQRQAARTYSAAAAITVLKTSYL